MRKNFLFSQPNFFKHKMVHAVTEYGEGCNMEEENGAAISTGTYGFAIANNQRSIAIATGKYGAATALKRDSLAIAWGIDSKVKGVIGSNIAAMFTDDEGMHIIIKKVDDENIKANTWYSIKNGKLKISE